MKISNIEAASTVEQTLAVGQPAELGTIVRRYSPKCPPFEVNGTQLILETAGYYLVNLEVTYEGATAGELTIGIYSNGVLVPYSTITETIAADTGTISDSSSVIIRVLPNAPVTITVVPTGVGMTLSKIDIKAVKLV